MCLKFKGRTKGGQALKHLKKVKLINLCSQCQTTEY